MLKESIKSNITGYLKTECKGTLKKNIKWFLKFGSKRILHKKMENQLQDWKLMEPKNRNVKEPFITECFNGTFKIKH